MQVKKKIREQSQICTNIFLQCELRALQVGPLEKECLCVYNLRVHIIIEIFMLSTS